MNREELLSRMIVVNEKGDLADCIRAGNLYRYSDLGLLSNIPTFADVIPFFVEAVNTAMKTGNVSGLVLFDAPCACDPLGQYGYIGFQTAKQKEQSMNILTARNGYLIVKLEETDARTAAGIIVPTSQGLARRATVRSATATTMEELELTGMEQTILIRPHGGFDLEHNGEQLLAIHQADVIGIYSE